MQIKVLLLVLVTALFIAGCTSGNTQVGGAPFVGGSEGLSLSFAAQSPPDEVFDNGQYPFSVVVDIRNLGEYDVEENDGYVELVGINAQTYDITDADLIEDIPEIDGANKAPDGTIISGLQDIVSFNGLNYQQNLRGSLPSTIRASACYNYETKASVNLCIKEDTVDGLAQNEICTISGEKQVFNSGAPIHIERLTQTPQGRDGVQVSFVISHNNPGSDLFYRQDTECDSLINNPDMYVVYVDVDPIVSNSIRADCSGFQEGSGDSGYVKLFQGTPRTVVCSFDVGSVNGEFIEPLNINLRYRYQQFIEKSVLIRDVSSEDDE